MMYKNTTQVLDDLILPSEAKIKACKIFCKTYACERNKQIPVEESRDFAMTQVNIMLKTYIA